MQIIRKDLGWMGIALYNGCLALEKRGILYVFKDISPKRLVRYRNISLHWCTIRKGNLKVRYVSNKELLDMPYYFAEIKELVLDGKLGTRFKSTGRLGSYFHCLQDGSKPIPVYPMR
jgi:hypothetical protein